MKKLFRRLFPQPAPPLSIEEIEQKLIQLRISRCESKVTKHESSRFYEEASVMNLQKDNSKISIGSNTHIRGELVIYPYGGKIEIGDNCYIGADTRVWSGEQIKMGNNVLISHGVNIMDFAHERTAADRGEGFRNLIKLGHPKVKGKIPTAAITIEDDVAIYAGVHVMMGITIGRGSVIAAGSVITRDVPPFTLMSGNPAKAYWKLK